MITGAVNSLVWILVLIAIVAVVIAVVRATLGPRVERPVVEQPVVEQPVVQHQPLASSGLTPGWYPDQQDINTMRYFDGRVWTAQTQPRT
jgi:hypothetical protein